MPKYILICFFYVCSVWLHAQRQYTFTDASEYLPKTVILKVKPQFRASCTESGIDHALYRKLAADLQVNRIYKKFKNEQAPAVEKNSLGQTLTDLSLIYEITYSGNIPMEKALSSLMSTGLFQYAEPHIVPKLSYNPNDPLANPSNQYHLQTINAFNAWSVNRGDSSIVIGITDTGTDTSHLDLFNSIKRNLADPIDMIDNDGDGYVDNYMGWDLGMNDNDPTYQANAHGVHVCGIAGATADNNTGGAGVGFNCKILPVKIGDANGNLIAAYEGIKYAADHGCTAINCSWGANSGTQYGQDIVNYATINKNALVVAAAGNNGNSIDFFPAAFDHVFAVANTDASDVLVLSSDYGYFVDVCAPGNNVNSTWPGNFYITLTGTSMSSPCVAGAAGLVKKQFPSYTGLQIAERLRVTADNIYGSNPSYINKLGSGRINLYRALTDPATPSIVFDNKLITDHNDDTFVSGDTLFISGHFNNYLAPTTALSATLTSLSAFANPLDNTTYPGVVNTLNYADNISDPFTFKLSGSIPLNQSIDFRLDIQDGTYQTVAFFSVYLNTDYINITINDINTTATSLGRIGYNTNGQAQGLGFK
ncbi:MAG: S8 family serine peptidase [Bacteroidetes bacterium]|nr:S8 family serine peptidase [Bacteroidota bacterium]